MAFGSVKDFSHSFLELQHKCYVFPRFVHPGTYLLALFTNCLAEQAADQRHGLLLNAFEERKVQQSLRKYLFKIISAVDKDVLEGFGLG